MDQSCGLHIVKAVGDRSWQPLQEYPDPVIQLYPDTRLIQTTGNVYLETKKNNYTVTLS